MTALAWLSAFRYALATGIADYSTMYTWRTWTAGWLSRVLCQVAFFALIGRLLDSPSATAFLLVGNAVVMAAVESCFVTASTTWERRSGTLPLLVASPAGPLLAFGARSLFWPVSGTLTASISLFVLAPLFGVPLPLPAALLAVPLIALVALATYTFALTLSGYVLRAMEARNVVGNVAHLSLMALCGVQIPVVFWPGWVQAVASVLPVRHGLLGVRALLAGEPGGTVLRHAALEAAVGVGWLAVAALTFRRLAEHGRRDGSIEFGS
jgi:ABC-2 type transport system permease protein